MSPNEKDVINITKPDHLFVFLAFKETCPYLFINIPAYGGAHLVPITF